MNPSQANEAYCDVAVAVPAATTFTYAVPAALREAVQLGSRVLVPFRRRSMVGVVVKLGTEPPAGAVVREIASVMDLAPALHPALLELGQWITGYYIAPPGEVFRAMLPPVTEVRARRELHITDAGRAAFAGAALKLMPEDERAVFDALLRRRGALLLTGNREMAAMGATIARMQRRGLVEIRETLLGRKRRTQKIVTWKTAGNASEKLAGEEAAAVELTPNEEKLRRILEHERGPLPLPALIRISGVSRSVIERLLREGKLESWEEPIDLVEDPFDVGFTPPAHELNDAQEQALNAIRAQLEMGAFSTQLLFGVTGSGKTEVYLRSIQEALARGKTAIVLVPEIALTLWIGRLCRAWFGVRYEGVAVLHSALSDVERAREWWRVRNGEARVVVGTRSAVFAPVENLGLIIVDEEQENSYKQEETPRYHGRDVAIVRAKLEGAVALLGSATPSLETFHHARAGKYELFTLPSRIENRPMAPVEIVDLREDFRETHDASPISGVLRKGIEECLRDGTQALILINRRGYSWFVLCRSCGASVQCVNCSIAMTYHKQRNRLECHYCGSIQMAPKKCPKCESQYVYFFGEGSEQLEERLRRDFPGARIGRLDRDTARTKRQFQETLGAFAAGALDILVGTQMLAKGHDFHRVTLVGVISADGMLHMPDFRAAERTFQLLTQVAGRAGRGELPGRVLVQSYFPEHYAIRDAAQQDYIAFFERELHFRKMMMYPPFAALANVIVRDTSLENAIQWSRRLSEFFAPHDGKGIRILGPAAAPLARLKREHRFQFLLKSPKRSLLAKVLHGALGQCERLKIPGSAVLVDMDPLSLM